MQHVVSCERAFEVSGVMGTGLKLERLLGDGGGINNHIIRFCPTNFYYGSSREGIQTIKG